MPLIDMSECYQMTNVGAHIDGTDVYQTNPNLLDNPWFTVRQRGDGPFSANTPAVDRWRTTSNATITATANGITLTTTMRTWGMVQRVAKGFFTVGKTYTISAMEQDGTITSASFEWTGSAISRYVTGANVGFEISVSSSAYEQIYITTNYTGDVYLKAVKLELGSVSTLANDTPPDYGTELLKCQRYFVRLKKLYSIVATGYALNATTPCFFAPTPVPLRDGVALTSAISGLYVAAPSGFRAVSAIAIQNSGTAYSASGVFFNATTTGLSSGEVCMLQVRDGNGYLDFSADL